jgi:hydroxyethylthiazole kinase
MGHIAKGLAKKHKCAVVISGAVDTISDGDRIIYIENGHSMLGELSGSGCMCSSLIGSFCGASPDEPFLSAVAAMACMGIAGECAYEISKVLPDGTRRQGSFQVALRDIISSMDDETLEKRVKCREA